MRCIWCNRDDDTVREAKVALIDRWGRNAAERPFAVHPEHEEEFRRFAAHANRNGRLFLFGMAALVAFMVAVGPIVHALGLESRMVIVGTGGALVLMGLLTFVFPFATPETTAGTGIALSITIARTGAIVMAALGLVIMVFLG